MTTFRQWTTFAFAPLWRWKWLLLSLILATSIYSLTSVRAEGLQSGRQTLVPSFRCSLAQGWPRQYVVRASQKSDLSVWAPLNQVKQFEVSPLLSNLAFTSAISLAFVCAWSWHCQRNGKPWRFTLKELLLITLLIAASIGGTLFGRNRFLSGEAYLISLETTGWKPFDQTSIPPWYLQPQYDCGLLGVDQWSHSTGILWSEVRTNPDINEAVIPLAARGEQLPAYVVEIRVMNSYLTDKGASAICTWAPDCRRFYLLGTRSLTSQGLTEIADKMPQLETFFLFGDATFSDASVQAISRMNNLRSLMILDSQHQTNADSLPHLKNLPNLQSVRLPHHWKLSRQEQEEFASRGVEIYSLGP